MAKIIQSSLRYLVLVVLMLVTYSVQADDSRSAKKIALINSLNPELTSLSDKEKKKIVGDGIRFAQTVIYRPNTIESSLNKIKEIKASLDARLKDFANTPRQSGEKAETEMLYESRTLAHVINLIQNHQAGKLDLNNLQKELGIRQRISKSRNTKAPQEQTVENKQNKQSK